jgi:hypothetical protein
MLRLPGRPQQTGHGRKLQLTLLGDRWLELHQFDGLALRSARHNLSGRGATPGQDGNVPRAGACRLVRLRILTKFRTRSAPKRPHTAPSKRMIHSVYVDFLSGDRDLRPVTPEIAGSSPVGPAKLKHSPAATSAAFVFSEGRLENCRLTSHSYRGDFASGILRWPAVRTAKWFGANVPEPLRTAVTEERAASVLLHIGGGERRLACHATSRRFGPGRPA